MELIETLEQGVALFERTRREYTNDLANLAAYFRQRGIAGMRQIDLQHLDMTQVIDRPPRMCYTARKALSLGYNAHAIIH